MATSFARDVRSAPNVISLSRILLVAIAAPLYFYGPKGVAIGLAVLAGVTDYLDGWLARATGQVTRLGAILDQFGDLCFESLLLLIAVSEGFFPPVVLFLYLLREFWVVSIRRFMAASRLDIPSSVWGKLKTNFVMWGFLPTYLSLAGVAPGLEPHLGHAGRLIVGLGILFSYVGAVGYTRAFVAGYGQAGGTDPAHSR